MNWTFTRLAPAVLAISVVAGACASGGRAQSGVPPGPGSPAPGAAGLNRDSHETLNGYLWVQTSAEFRALTSSLYRNAQVSLERATTDASWTALPDQTAAYQQLPGAVIMDLDETVLDNSA